MIDFNMEEKLINRALTSYYKTRAREMTQAVPTTGILRAVEGKHYVVLFAGSKPLTAYWIRDFDTDKPYLKRCSYLPRI